MIQGASFTNFGFLTAFHALLLHGRHFLRFIDFFFDAHDTRHALPIRWLIRFLVAMQVLQQFLIVRLLIGLVMGVLSRANQHLILLLSRLGEVLTIGCNSWLRKTESELHRLANLLLILRADQLIWVFMPLMSGHLRWLFQFDLDALDLDVISHGYSTDEQLFDFTIGYIWLYLIQNQVSVSRPFNHSIV